MQYQMEEMEQDREAQEVLTENVKKEWENKIQKA
jgi:hypothetical protein